MSNSNGKIKLFFKKNLLYIILGLCVLAIGLSVTLALVSNNNQPVQDLGQQTPPIDTPVDTPSDSVIPDDDTPVDVPSDTTPDTPVVKVITFIMPVENAESISEYSATPVFNQTLERYESHKAIDFFAPAGTEVLACYDGVVESITTEYLTGTTVIIDHGDGLKTKYNSLSQDTLVTVGQAVKSGDAIGTVSDSNLQEFMDGAHLHFEVIEDGVVIDPQKYLVTTEK